MALSKHRKPDGRPRPAAVPVEHPLGKLELPLCDIADHGVGPELAYEMISNELLLDGQARLNLATFVTTWMPSRRRRLMARRPTRT